MPDATAPRRLKKRDYWLLPLISALTLGFMALGAEVAARLIWPESMQLACLHTDPERGTYATPNCVSRVKAAEGPWVTNRYNECGLRATGPCGGFDARRPRIVVIGSSTSWGYMVPFNQVWSTRVAEDLSQRCGGTDFDVQSFVGFADINGNAQRIDEAIALQPDLVVMVIAPLDMEQINPAGFVPPAAGERVEEIEDEPENVLAWLRNIVSESRAGKIAQHFLYRNEDIYIPAFLTNGDKADFLREPMSQAWQNRVQAVDDALAYYNERFAAAGVPLMLVYAPQQAQAALISDDELVVDDIDPTVLPDALEEVAKGEGVLFADASDEFEGINHWEDMFYNADGHMNGDGHALIADAVESTLTETYGEAPLCPAAGAAD